MAKTICRCGVLLSNQLIPNDVELIVYTNKQWKEATQEIFVENMPEPSLDVWQCPKCDRLLFFESGVLIKVYAIESHTETAEGKAEQC